MIFCFLSDFSIFHSKHLKSFPSVMVVVVRMVFHTGSDIGLRNEMIYPEGC